MREYVIRGTSMYEGTHFIFENESELRGTVPNGVKVYKWAIDPFMLYQVGDYIQAEDGYIVQILSIKKMKSKKLRKGQTFFIRFPMGTFAVYQKADGTVHYPRFYAQFTSGDKGSASKRARSNFSGTKDESIKRFAKLVHSGIDNRTAYRMAFNYRKFITNTQIDKKISDIYNNDVFIKELVQLLEPMKENLNEKFNDSRLLDSLDILLKNIKKGSSAHRETIRFILQLKGYVP